MNILGAGLYHQTAIAQEPDALAVHGNGAVANEAHTEAEGAHLDVSTGHDSTTAALNQLALFGTCARLSRANKFEPSGPSDRSMTQKELSEKAEVDQITETQKRSEDALKKTLEKALEEAVENINSRPSGPAASPPTPPAPSDTPADTGASSDSDP